MFIVVNMWLNIVFLECGLLILVFMSFKKNCNTLKNLQLIQNAVGVLAGISPRDHIFVPILPSTGCPQYPE